jgi:hypothetical protein
LLAADAGFSENVLPTHPVDREIQVVGHQPLTIQQCTLTLLVTKRPRCILQVHHLLQNALLVLVEERGKLAGVDGRVKLEEGAHGWDGELRGDVGEEQVNVTGVGVYGWVSDPECELLVILVRWGDGREEFGAGAEEELAEDGESLGATEKMSVNREQLCRRTLSHSPATLHRRQLITVMLLDDGHDTLIGWTWRQGGADGKERVHPLALLGDLVAIGCSGQCRPSRIDAMTTALTEPYW